MKVLGGTLKVLREDKRYSLRDVENLTGVSNAYISQMETGKVKNPSPHFLRKLSKIYGMSYIELMILAGYLDKKVMKPVEDKIKKLECRITSLEVFNGIFKPNIIKYKNGKMVR
jgi:transcriptional regulator with XRE-family HTH domain